MDAKLSSINRHLKKYDPDLFAERSNESDLIGIYRRTVRWESYSYYGVNLSVSRPHLEPVTYLTNTWTIHGTPVDWGIEPVIDRIRSLDAWNQDRFYEDLVEERERAAQNKQRALKNEIRARAADMRKDFAKAVNDINTSTLDRVDSRRIKDGSCK